ncbi:preprotein translocase subunit YajC [Shouchella clausii]|jgi:preprotein translocase subunit YajC|uniref:Preprotein translocase subunit YajC n=1 Tax=Shouchella clausii TaxID=79880 RepID=A0A268S4T6_SHOCL|nr:preprotein translocase subunit YajC [Shouchella clausii]PAD43720.1 preprotein translocase subunit YajC [Bacillus sp. 7520-S]SPU21574.1 preprotein translocase YajC subunit [Niallia circulans]AST98211.1 preprotein translocase subunit YajC [Shouchella clausii]MBU8595236.1 preprotein translocase subunit YajC [Shouchella clausii]MCM3549679.1 preprotein translocase subunit YajC [Shouchella clausii]
MELLVSMLPFIAIIVLFYFLLIRPQQKQQKRVREMHANLQRGDKIITIGGLHGVIDSIDESVVVLLVNDNRKLTYDRTAIREVVQSD